MSTVSQRKHTANRILATIAARPDGRDVDDARIRHRGACLAGVKTYLLGPDRLPVGVRLRKAACEKTLTAMGDVDEAARVVLALVPPILAAAQLEGRHARLSDAVRTSRFSVNALNGVMKLYD
jgi:hypothetical protein